MLNLSFINQGCGDFNIVHTVDYLLPVLGSLQIFIRGIRALNEESLDPLDMNCDILFYKAYIITLIKEDRSKLKVFLLMIDEVVRIDDRR